MRIPAVAHGDRDISAQAGAFGAANGRAAELLPEFFRADFAEPLERGVDQPFSRLELGCAGRWCFAVPGTDILADVASEDVAADAFAHFFGDRAALFDGQVRNAFVGIELVGRDQRVRRAGFDTAGATAAAIGRRQITRGPVST
jgi:hypothetical protein